MGARKKTKEGFSKTENGTGGHRGTALEGDWLALAAAFGGVVKLADALRISHSTLHRWSVKGDNIPGPCVTLIRILAAQQNVKSPV